VKELCYKKENAAYAGVEEYKNNESVNYINSNANENLQIEGSEMVNEVGNGENENHLSNKLQKNSVTEVKILNMMKISKKKDNCENVCKVCLGDESTKENPLIVPCKCSGTMKFVHLDCLKHWFKSKVVSKSFDYMTVYSLKTLECDLCKGEIKGNFIWFYFVRFIERVKINGEIKYIIDIEIPKCSHIILESRGEEEVNKIIYVVAFRNNLTSLKIVNQVCKTY